MKILPTVSRYRVEIVLAFLIFSLILAIIISLPKGPVEDEYIGMEVEVVEGPGQIIEKPQDVKVVSAPPVAPPKPAIGKSTLKPRIALIIDDLGANLQMAERLLLIDAPIAFAVLPHLKFSRSIALAAGERKKVVLLHLPMEPKSNAFNPGQGALLLSLSEEQIVATLREDLKSVPGAVGANNHMGSRFTEDREKTMIVMEEMKRNNLFFVDSKTTAGSVAYDVALNMGAPTAARDVFLDNERDKTKIVEALFSLADKALMTGSAIGIGHPYKETLEALEETLPKIRGMGIEVAPLTQLLVTKGE